MVYFNNTWKSQREKTMQSLLVGRQVGSLDTKRESLVSWKFSDAETKSNKNVRMQLRGELG
jgi:hypothetical protein